MAVSESNPAWIVTALTRERGTAKEAAVRAIASISADGERATLRTLMLRALRTEFAPPPAGQEEDVQSSDARCWLLSALGRVADDDNESIVEVRKHLDSSYEPNIWARYWALEGIVAGKPADLADVARKACVDEEPLVSSLGFAILASKGDVESQRKVQHSAGEWAMLRALRVVPLPTAGVVQSLCEIVERGFNRDETFDAIVALGSIPATSHFADRAAQALSKYVVEHRWPMYDAMRTRALAALANLRVEREAPVLIEELADANQGIVSEAARALEAVLGVRIATSRILEAAAASDQDAQVKFGAALRYMKRTEVVSELENAMLTGSDAQQTAARTLLSEVGGAEAFQRLRARTTAASQYISVLEGAEEKVRELFQESIVDARRGFKIATSMDIAVFAVGIVLVLGSALAILIQGGTLDSWAGVGITGGAGVLGIIYGLLIANPRRQVREAVDHLMRLKVVFLAYLRQLHQLDQAYTRRLLDDKDLPADEVVSFTTIVGDTMAKVLSELPAPRTERIEPAAERADRPQRPDALTL